MENNFCEGCVSYPCVAASLVTVAHCNYKVIKEPEVINHVPDLGVSVSENITAKTKMGGG